MKAYYMIPVSMSNGGLPMEYHLEEYEKDMRTRECRRYESYEVDMLHALRLIAELKMVVIVNDPKVYTRHTRVIAPSGNTATKFFKEIYK